MNESVARNYRECVGAIATGDIATVARKVSRSCEILREKNTLSTLENVVLRFVERIATDLC